MKQIATAPKRFAVELDREVVERLAAVFPGQNQDELVMKAIKRLIGEAELRQFAAQKQLEVQEEAKRLNVELGLA